MHKSFPSCTGELWLGNRWKLPKGAPLISTDPVYQLPLWKSKSAEAVDIDTGIQAAQQAFRAWSQQPHAAREAIIRSIKQELEFFKIPLAQSISEETGKPLWEATAEIQSTLKKLDVAIQSYQTRTGEHVQLMPFGDARLMHRPLGVIGVLGPFNFPLQIPLSQIISLLLAGNTVIFKPSEHTPRMGELIARLCEKAGIPPGVLNLIQGAGGVGALLAEHPRLDGLFFTGSADTGIQLHRQFGGHPEKMLVLEMGGNNPIIFWDAGDITSAAYSTLQSAFISSGQRCVCARRLIIPDGREGQRFIDTLLEMTHKIRIAAYDADPQPFMGSLIHNTQAKRMIATQTELIQQGGKSLLSLKPLQSNTGLVTPGIIDMTAVDARTREDREYFGPLLQVIRVKTFEEAIQEAQHTRYGLSASIFTEDAEKAEQFRQNIRAGVINWNRPTVGSLPELPFGGVGSSGNYRPTGAYTADACAFPVSQMWAPCSVLPEKLLPGIVLPKTAMRE